MNTASVTTNQPTRPLTAFWPRQFTGQPTAKQLVFDVLFGVVAPILCVLFDPAVFNPNGLMTIGFLHNLRLFGYLEIALGIFALSYCLLTRKPSMLLTGALYAGVLFSLLLGIAILPISFLGLLIVIGVFGFTPFVSAFVLWRNASRCRQQAQAADKAFPRRNGSRTAILAAALTLCVPVGIQIAAAKLSNCAMKTVLSGPSVQTSRALKTLKYLRVAAPTDDLVDAYLKTTDQAERARLASAYQQITDQYLDERITELND